MEGSLITGPDMASTLWPVMITWGNQNVSWLDRHVSWLMYRGWTSKSEEMQDINSCGDPAPIHRKQGKQENLGAVQSSYIL